LCNLIGDGSEERHEVKASSLEGASATTQSGLPSRFWVASAVALRAMADTSLRSQ
jgi:hypothetical protein